MKPKIQSKKDPRFIVKMIPLALFFVITTLVFNSCQKEELMPITAVNNLKSAALSDDGYVRFYTNELFIREAGKPVIIKRTIGKADIGNYESCFKLHVQSGYNGDDFVSSATVKIDGVTILSTSDFNNSNQGFQFDLCNLTATSVMEVKINGTPGSTLEIWIDGKLNTSGTFIDERDGNIYKWVRIGNQIWMAENLAATKFNDGSEIPNITGSSWSSLTTPSYCWLNNDPASFKATYGALYNWYAIITGKLSPTGWHVPSDAEWTTLIDYLGGFEVAGGKLKEIGYDHWLTPNTGADNSYNFTALPGGCRYGNGDFYSIPTSGHWHTSTEYNTDFSWYFAIDNTTTNVTRTNYTKKNGLSVRCVKD